MLVFAEEGKPENGEKHSEQGENQQQAQPTYHAESDNRARATLMGGECSHHCVIPVPIFGSEIGAKCLNQSLSLVMKNQRECELLSMAVFT